MKKQIKDTLRKYKKEARKCLYPLDGWTWGMGNKQQTQNTVDLMNKILREIPQDAWPQNKDDSTIFQDGNWRLDLKYVKNRRSANLIYLKDDHTAWVIENRAGKFIDFDIGGS